MIPEAPIRTLVVTLTLAALASACGSEDCPATGAALLPGIPKVEPEYGPGCVDAHSWTANVEPANATWTIELRRDVDGLVHVAPVLDDVAVMVGTELILVDGEGEELSSRDVGVNASWSSFAVTDQGQMVLADQAGNKPTYRVLSPSGADVWLRQLEVDNLEFGPPGLSLAADGSLWVAMTRYPFGTYDYELVVQQWAPTGGMQSELVLSHVREQQFARDGVGRFLVIDAELELFGPDGTHVGSADIGDPPIHQVIGLDDGFVAAGQFGNLPGFVRIDGQGKVVWFEPLPGTPPDDSVESFVSGMALLPDGGLVAVGREQTIHYGSPIPDTGQPFVVALDDEGEPTWGERLAVGGSAIAVAVGPQGAVYVVGRAQATPSGYGSLEEVVWLRRYDP